MSRLEALGKTSIESLLSCLTLRPIFTYNIISLKIGAHLWDGSGPDNVWQLLSGLEVAGTGSIESVLSTRKVFSSIVSIFT